MQRILKAPYTPLIAILFIVFILHLFLFIDVRYNDNLFCAYNAFRLQEGTYTLEYNSLPGNVIARRFGLLLPMALFYKLFGITTFTSGLVPLLFSLATIFLLYKFCLEFFSKKCAIISAILLSCYPLHFIYATQLYVDIAISFFFCWSSYVFLKASVEQNSSTRKKLLFLSGLIIGLGHLVKENAFFIFSFFIIYSIIKKLNKKEFILTIAGFLIIPFLEIIFYWISTGDPFHRYDVINREHTKDLETMFFKSTADSLNRMFVVFPSMMLNPLDKNFPYVGPFSYLFILSIIYLTFTKRTSEIKFSLSWWIGMAMCLFLWPIKLSPYIPSFLPWVRTLEPITIPMIITIGYAISTLSVKSFQYTVIMAIVIVSMITNYFIATYLDSWTIPTKEAFLTIKSQKPKVIYTDYLLENKHGMANLLQYWNRFEPGLKVIVFTEENLPTAKEGYVFINWDYVQQNIYESRGEYKLPPQIYNPPSNWEKIYEKEVPKRQSLPGVLKSTNGTKVKNYKIQIFKINL